MGLSAIVCPTTQLAASAAESCAATYTTTAADLTAESITNVDTVTGTLPTGANVSATSTATLANGRKVQFAVVGLRMYTKRQFPIR